MKLLSNTFDFLRVQFLLRLASKKPNCLTSKSEKTFPLRKGLVISAHAQVSSLVLKWGMQVQIHYDQCVLCMYCPYSNQNIKQNAAIFVD